MRVVGLMSGTSLDGIDAALVEFDGAPASLEWRLVAFASTPYDGPQRRLIHEAILNGGAAELCELNGMLGEWFAEAALNVCRQAGVEPADVDLIGCHGQTVWHSPPRRDHRGTTLQLGCAATIAERTGIAVVSDFRSRDMAAGGQGAPLVPWVDALLFADPARTRVLLNVGGIANLTRVPPRGAADAIVAFDTGPGNAMIDAAVELASDGVEAFDRGGERAARGRVDEALLRELLGDDYFLAEPPKSTGRERWGRPAAEALARRVGAGGAMSWDDFIATLTALTAASVADAVRRWVLPRGADELVVTGGGARNPTLVDMIAQRLAPLPVMTGASLGIEADAKEAIAFAALAWAHERGIPANLPAATGAVGPRVLGSRTPGAAARERPSR